MMVLLRLISGRIVVSFLAAASFVGVTHPAGQIEKGHEGRIYTAALNYLAQGLRAEQRVGIVIPSTSISVNGSLRELGFPVTSHEDLSRRLPEAQQETIKDFLRKSEMRTTIGIARHVNRRVPATVVPDAAVAGVLETNDVGAWTEFRRAHARARYVIRFSPIGFNADSTEALVFVSRFCEGLCGGGDLMLLRRVKGAWRVHRMHQLWIA